VVKEEPPVDATGLVPAAAYVLETESTGDKKNPLRVVPRLLAAERKDDSLVSRMIVGRFNYGKVEPRRFNLRIMIPKGAAVENLGISTVIAHNMYAGPYLVPGKNKVTVSTDSADKLKEHPLIVTYTFGDGENWAEEQVVRKEIDRSPCDFEITVKGPKHPRMKSVSVEVK
ncbi:MAG: hypothetical protein C0404_14155, partial [Verrucomicrobia bacterium]|nr:hypothetical protein [Verrucomicrobiota bacterium]